MAGNKILDGIFCALDNNANVVINSNDDMAATALGRAIAGDIFYQGNISFYKDGNSYKPRRAYVPQLFTIKNLANTTDFYYQQRYNAQEANDAVTLQQELEKQVAAINSAGTLIEQLHLQHRLHTPLIQLSNGELKKTQLIRYLLANPEILILENPFAGLDAGSRADLELILEKYSNSGTKIILLNAGRHVPKFIGRFIFISNKKITDNGAANAMPAGDFTQHIHFSKPLPALAKIPAGLPLIDFKNVTVRYGEKTVLKNIDWQVKSGESWWIKGHNGAGKTTLLSLIYGDHPQAYAQNITLFGKRRGTGESIWDIKSKTGFVSPELYHHFDKSITAFDTVASGYFDTIGLFKKLTPAQKENTENWLDYFDLKDKKNTPLHSLSISAQKILMIIRAVAKSPLLLALDEPFQGIAAKYIPALNSFFNILNNEYGISILFINHYEDECPAFLNNILELENGVAKISQTNNQHF